MGRRRATEDDLDRVTETVTLAFATDPVWSVALRRSDGGTEHQRPYWRLFVEGAARHGTVFLVGDGAAVSVWLPPGTTELDEAGSVALDALVAASLDTDAQTRRWRRYSSASRPAEPGAWTTPTSACSPRIPSIAGTASGSGSWPKSWRTGTRLASPTYLESTNPANDHRYARLGFQPDGGFRAVRDDAWVSAMWRPVAAGRGSGGSERH